MEMRDKSQNGGTMTATKKVEMYAYHGKGWVAEVTGLDHQYGLARRFLESKKSRDRSTPYYDVIIDVPLIEGNVYEWSEQTSGRRTDQGYWRVESGQLVDIDLHEVHRCFEA